MYLQREEAYVIWKLFIKIDKKIMIIAIIARLQLLLSHVR